MSKKGKKAQQRAKRRQKSALKQQRRAKLRQPHRKPPAKDAIPEARFPKADRTFWLAHGVNFLTSNYDEGEWAPMFPEIYEGTVLDEDTISTRLIALAKEDEDQMTAQQRAVLGYAFQDPSAHYIFKTTAERMLKAAGDEDPVETARQPHQPVVWEMFHEQIMVKAMSRVERKSKAGIVGDHDDTEVHDAQPSDEPPGSE